MRLLFLSLHGQDLVPAQRFRFEQFIPHLEANGVQVDHKGLLTADDSRRFYGRVSPAQKASVALTAMGRCAARVFPAAATRRYDVVFVQREAFFLGGPWFERLATWRTPYIYDFDDSIWVNAISDANRRFAFLKSTTKISDLTARAHTVTVGNEFLAQWARQRNTNVHVVPTTIDTASYQPRASRADGPVVVGWSGSLTTVVHFKTVIPALERVKAKLGSKVSFLLMGDAGYRHEGLGIVGKAWRAQTEVTDLHAIDIGLMPLPDDELTRGKCGLKGLQYMALGIPTLMSPVGVNRDIIQDGVNGYLPANEDEWVGRICALVEDAALRKRLGDAGRQTVLDKYSVDRWKSTYLDLVRRAGESSR